MGNKPHAGSCKCELTATETALVEWQLGCETRLQTELRFSRAAGSKHLCDPRAKQTAAELIVEYLAPNSKAQLLALLGSVSVIRKHQMNEELVDTRRSSAVEGRDRYIASAADVRKAAASFIDILVRRCSSDDEIESKSASVRMPAASITL